MRKPAVGATFELRFGVAAALVAAVLVAVVVAGCGGSADSDAARSQWSVEVAGGCEGSATRCTLRDVGDAAGVRVGAAVTSRLLAEGAEYGRVLAREFSSVTPEFEASWTFLEQTRGKARFAAMDTIVGFAARHRMAVRGHALVWDQRGGLPEWVSAIDHPEALRGVLDDHIRGVVGRYRGRVARWDVVNEPLESDGPRLAAGHLQRVLGADYIADAFRSAHAADPDAVLYLNESNVESVPSKADALVDLVADLVRQGVPIGGVGLEMHLLGGRPPRVGVVRLLVGRLRALGVEVAVTEMDVPVARDGSDRDQVLAYRRVGAECREAGCSEVTTWGVGDAHTWLDTELGRRGNDPLLFDRRLRPKAAYRALRAALAVPGGVR